MFLADGPSVSEFITRTLAQEIRDMPTIKHDRKLSERRVSIYKKSYNQGLFRSPEWDICLNKEDSILYRVNGKHTSTMFCDLENDQGLYATIHHFTAETMEDVIKLYGTFDNPNQNRSKGDINGSFAACWDELDDFPVKLINDTVTGINYAKLKKGIYKLTNTDRAEELLDYENVKFMTWMMNHLYKGRSPKNQIWKGPIVACIYNTYHKDKDKALEFWQRVRDESGENPEMPCRKLAKFLLCNKMLNSDESVREFYTRSATAWNAWRKGRMNPSLNYFKNSDIPEVI